ncbi:serine/threonine-protein kinase [Azohydromonas lata]|uniref:Serine/threonine-protein kinase n=1 Tax=Azohydromonas lata TaxID=45677 RepID=A0ABU5IK45_9BURK|nr:serine/threonine-protein kinase [Azohydromonas lata]MDZ5459244.1 serine/threonine-protein kinase [Azohydromonas lata]
MSTAIGDVIADRYKIESEIGYGGMQRVWQARDLSLERNIAIKSPFSPGAIKRFASSARLSAKVRHPNVAAALDYIDQGGKEYYVEELIDGINLQDCMDAHFPRLDADTCARVMHHLAKGVASSHRVNVIHRDLKPSNIMVSRDLSFSNIKITDFGIAKLAQSQIDQDIERLNNNHTEGLTSTMLGAIPFLAPEVLKKGNQGAPQINLPSDVWSLGAIGYWLLAGEHPFGKGLEAAVNILTEQRKPWAPSITASRITSHLAQKLQKIIEGCLVSDPTVRPTAESLASNLGALGYLSGVRESAVITSAGKYGGVWWGRSETGESVMTHNEEVIAGGILKVGSRINYISCPGSPSPRAVAVIKMKDEKVKSELASG